MAQIHIRYNFEGRKSHVLTHETNCQHKICSFVPYVITSISKRETASASKTLVITFITTRCHNPEEKPQIPIAARTLHVIKSMALQLLTAAAHKI